jgi:hypothetical protein
MYSLIIEDLEAVDLLDYDFTRFKQTSYGIGLHLNRVQHPGYFTFGITNPEPFSFRVADGRIYLTGDIDIPYHETPIYYIEENLEEILTD